jgi:hypothetical protein
MPDIVRQPRFKEIEFSVIRSTGPKEEKLENAPKQEVPDASLMRRWRKLILGRDCKFRISVVEKDRIRPPRR